MNSKIFVILHCIALCFGSYYEPPAQVCPTEIHVKTVDIERACTQIQIVPEGPYPDIDIYPEIDISTSVVTATKVVLATTTEALERLTFTKVTVEKSALVVTQTKVSTVTKFLENTHANIVTVTATNYHTDFVTKQHIQTVISEKPTTSTIIKGVPRTTTEVVPSTFTITKSHLITTEITSTVPYTQAVYVTVHQPAKIHTFTETKTRTVCPRTY